MTLTLTDDGRMSFSGMRKLIQIWQCIDVKKNPFPSLQKLVLKGFDSTSNVSNAVSRYQVNQILQLVSLNNTIEYLHISNFTLVNSDEIDLVRDLPVLKHLEVENVNANTSNVINKLLAASQSCLEKLSMGKGIKIRVPNEMSNLERLQCTEDLVLNNLNTRIPNLKKVFLRFNFGSCGLSYMHAISHLLEKNGTITHLTLNLYPSDLHQYLDNELFRNGFDALKIIVPNGVIPDESSLLPGGDDLWVWRCIDTSCEDDECDYCFMCSWSSCLTHWKHR